VITLPTWPEARAQLRAAALPWALALLTMLLTVLSLALVARRVGAGPYAFVLAVFLPLAGLRLLAGVHGRARWARVALLMGAAIPAVELPLLLVAQPAWGVGVLMATACAALWWQGSSRAGALGAAAGALVVRIALLVPPGGASSPLQRAALALGVATLACAWALAMRWAVGRWRPGRPVAGLPPAANGASRERQVVQMGAALALAAAAGHWLAPVHASWALLSAFIVLEGTSTRQDVQHKALWRVLGATLGTAGAALAAGMLATGSAWNLLALLMVFAVAGWLRALNTAWWTAGMTACLSLLYSYLGADALSLLGHRLLALCAGAAVALACAVLAEHLALRRRATA
jgi:hypothetical protein